MEKTSAKKHDLKILPEMHEEAPSPLALSFRNQQQQPSSASEEFQT